MQKLFDMIFLEVFTLLTYFTILCIFLILVLPYEGLASPLRLASSGGKPLTLKRGPGRPPGTRPRKDVGVRLKKPLGLKLKRWKGYE